MQRLTYMICLVFLALTTGLSNVGAEEALPLKLQKLTDEAYRYYSARETDKYFEAGKTLFVYTDGINEAENIHKEQFGEERLKALLQKDLGNARETSEAIHRAVEDFVGGAEPSDDLTKMCIIMY